MKIVKSGKIPTHITCHNCDCEFIYNKDDIQSDSDWNPEGSGDEIDVYDCRNVFTELAKKYKTVLAVGWRYYRSAYVECPECGEIIYINDSYGFTADTHLLVSNKTININYDDVYDKIRLYNPSYSFTTVMANTFNIMGDCKMHRTPLSVHMIKESFLKEIGID